MGSMAFALLFVALLSSVAFARWLPVKPSWRSLVGVALGSFAAVGVLQMSGSTTAASFGFNVEVGSSNDPNAVRFDSITVGAFEARLDSATTSGQDLNLLFGTSSTTKIKGLPAFSVDQANYFTTADGGTDVSPRLVLTGDTTVLGQTAEVILTLKWQDLQDTSPQIAVLFRFDAIDLTKLNPDWTDFPVGLSDAVVGVGIAFDSNGDAVEQLMLPVILDPDNARGFFEDAQGDVMSNVFVRNNGIALAASVTNGVLHDGAATLGPVKSISIAGNVGDSDALGDNVPSKSMALSVKVALDDPTTANTPPTELAKSGVTVDSLWEGDLRRLPDGSYDVGFAGNLSLDLDGRAFGFSGAFDVVTTKNTAPTPDTIRFRMTATASASPAVIPNLFGQDWLSLDEATITLELVRGATPQNAVTIGAKLTAGPVSGNASIKLGTTNGAKTVEVGVTGVNGITTNALASGLGVANVDPDWNVELKNMGFVVGATSAPGKPTAIRVTANAGATMFKREGGTCPNDGIETGVLFRLERGATNSFIVAAGVPLPGTTGQLNIKELTCGSGPDFVVPKLYATLNSSADKFTADWISLDRPTIDFFTPLMCADVDLDCPKTLEIDPGLGFLVQAPLDGEVGKALTNIGIQRPSDQTPPILLRGKLPLLGGNDTELSAQFPTLTNADQNAIFQSGNLSLFFGIEDGGTGASFGFKGTATLRIPRTDQTDCVGATGTFAAGCYDAVDFRASASIAVGVNPPSAKLSLLAKIDEWKQPFGLRNLTVNTAGFKVDVAVTNGVPEATMALGAKLSIGPNPETATDLTLGIKLGVVGTPPTPVLKNLTFASARGFSLREVTEAFAPELTPVALAKIPDLSLRNIALAYGIDADGTDADLCLVKGLYITAELHMGANPPPAATTRGCAPGAQPAGVPTCGLTSTTCLAGVRLVVKATGFEFQGKLAPVQAGPVHFNGLDVDISVSPTQQRFFFTSGATLYDPVAWANGDRNTDNVWASGTLTLSLEQKLGKLDVSVSGCALLGGTTPADDTCSSTDTLAKLGVSGSLSVSVADGRDFLRNAKADLRFTAESQALKQFADDVNAQLKKVADATVAAFNTVSTSVTDWRNANGEVICGLIPSASCSELIQLADDEGAVQTYINDQIRKTDDKIRNNIPLNLWCAFTRTPLGLQPCLDFYVNKARSANLQYISNQGGAGYIALHGINGTAPNSEIFVVAGDILVPATSFTWPASGVAPCQNGGSLADKKICQSLPNQVIDLTEEIGEVTYEQLIAIDPAIAEFIRTYVVENGLVQAARFDVSMFDALMAEEPVLAATDPPFDGSAFLRTAQLLGSRFDPTQPLSICSASISFVWPGEGSTDVPPPFELVGQVNAYGSNVVVPLAITNGRIDPTATSNAIIGETFDGPLDSLDCEQPESGDTSVTMTIAPTTVVEGSTVTATGTAAPGATVTVFWGDGTTVTAEAGEDGAWVSTHAFADGPAVYVVEAGVGDGATVSRVVSVSNAAPVVSSINVGSTVAEGSVLDLSAVVSDAGVLDTQSVTIDWGDGSSDLFALPGGGGEVDASHVYVDDDPTGTPSDQYTITIRVVDRDGARTSTTRKVTVTNVTPSLVGPLSITADGAPVTTDASGRPELPEGTTITVKGTLRDPGVDDDQRVQIAWTGLEVAPIIPERDALDPTLWHFEGEFVFLDDNPTGTARDPLSLGVYFADDDMAFADDDEPSSVDVSAMVVDVAPVVTLSAPTAAVQYSDALASVQISATDVVGFGTGATRSETLSISSRFRVDGGGWTSGLPAQLALTAGSCVEAAGRQTCTWTLSGRGDVAPGTYEIEFRVADDDTLASTQVLTVTVRPEDADVTFIGPRVVSAPSLTRGSIAVEMRAVVHDSSVLPGSGDSLAGDITKAKVSFVDRTTGRVVCTADVVPVFIGNTTTGNASCTATIAVTGAGPWTVQIGSVVGGWYVRDARTDDASITIVPPGTSQITGQHFVIADRGAGVLAPTTGTRVTVTLDRVGYASKPSAFSGSGDLVWVSGGRTYRATITSIDTLGSTSPVSGSRIGDVDARVTVTDITDAKRPVVVAQGLRLQLRYTDFAKNSTPDRMAFAIWRTDGTLLSGASWNGRQMETSVLAGGQVLVP